MPRKAKKKPKSLKRADLVPLADPLPTTNENLPPPSFVVSVISLCIITTTKQGFFSGALLGVHFQENMQGANGSGTDRFHGMTCRWGGGTKGVATHICVLGP